MDKSIEERIEYLNLISPIKETFAVTKEVNGSLISKEMIRIEKDGKVEEAEVVLSFTAGEYNKPFVAYTRENVEDKNDDYKATVDISEVVFTEDGYYLAIPSEEDHRNIVVPAIVAIGNDDTEDRHQLVENVRTAVNDPNFNIISLNAIDEYVGYFEEEYNETEQKDNIFIKLKSSISVLIPTAKLRKIKKQYIKEVNAMYALAQYDKNENLTSDIIEQELENNDNKYYQVGDLIEQFKELNEKTNSQKFDKDIKQLEELQDALDDARGIYLDKQAELNNEELQVEVESEEQIEELTEEVTQEIQPEAEIIETPEIVESVEVIKETEEPVASDENTITVETPIMFDEKMVDEPAKEEIITEEEPHIMEQFIDKNEGIEQMAEEIVAEQQSELIIKEEEDELKEQVETKLQDFNNEMEAFKQTQDKQYDEKYNRELEAFLKSVRNTYEEYIRNLRTELTDTLDKCILDANNSINELKTANENLKTSLATSEKSLKEEKADNKSLRTTINEKDKEISELKVKEQEYDKQNDEQKVEIDSLKKDNQDKDLRINGLESEIRKEKTNNETLNVELKAKDSRINELSANLEKAEEKNSDYKNQLETMSKNMDDLRTQSEDYRINTQREIEMLKAQLNNYQAFMSSMKKLQESTSEIASSYAFATTEEGKTK